MRGSGGEGRSSLFGIRAGTSEKTCWQSIIREKEGVENGGEEEAVWHSVRGTAARAVPMLTLY